MSTVTGQIDEGPGIGRVRSLVVPSRCLRGSFAAGVDSGEVGMEPV